MDDERRARLIAEIRESRADEFEAQAEAFRCWREWADANAICVREHDLDANRRSERTWAAAAIAVLEGRAPDVPPPHLEERVASLGMVSDPMSPMGADEAAPSQMYGLFVPWNVPTTISSPREGRFTEVVRRGALSEQIRAGRRPDLHLQHGRDAELGYRPLGVIQRLSEETDGGHFAASLIDHPYVAPVVAMVRAGALGASMGFLPVAERWRKPTRPGGLPQRELLSVDVREISAVVQPAYASTYVRLRDGVQDPAPRAGRHEVERAARARRVELARRGIASPAEVRRAQVVREIQMEQRGIRRAR